MHTPRDLQRLADQMNQVLLLLNAYIWHVHVYMVRLPASSPFPFAAPQPSHKARITLGEVAEQACPPPKKIGGDGGENPEHPST